IRDWLDIVQADKTKKSHVTSLEIWTDCLNGPARDIKKVDQIRITEIMRELGWVKGSFTKDGKAKFGYGRPKENSKE
ncbi:MAG: hypothetical protein GY928_09235, partial [Colwellia sp.]|nr:hypothetical protein [Colwellia sp.]